MSLRFIAADHCAYCMRIELMLKANAIEHENKTISLAEPPATIIQLSPLKTVPILVADKVPVFESLTILDFLNTDKQLNLLPDNTAQAANLRCWMVYANRCLADQYRLFKADSEEAFDQAEDDIHRRLNHLENFLCDDGAQYVHQTTLLDYAYAPIWFRYAASQDIIEVFSDGEFPMIHNWLERLREDPVLNHHAEQAFQGADFDAVVTGKHTRKLWPAENRENTA